MLDLGHLAKVLLKFIFHCYTKELFIKCLVLAFKRMQKKIRSFHFTIYFERMVEAFVCGKFLDFYFYFYFFDCFSQDLTRFSHQPNLKKLYFTESLKRSAKGLLNVFKV